MVRFLDLAKTPSTVCASTPPASWSSSQGDRRPGPGLFRDLKKVDTRLTEAERERLQALLETHRAMTMLGAPAQTLARALRTPSVLWTLGEMQLRRVVELSGMLERCDFDEHQDFCRTPAAFAPISSFDYRVASRSWWTQRRRSTHFSTRTRPLTKRSGH